MNITRDSENSSSKEEIVELLAEYSGQLRLHIEEEMKAELRALVMQRMLIVLFSTLAGSGMILSAWFDVLTINSERDIKVMLSAIAAMSLVAVSVAASSQLSKRQSRHRRNEVKATTRILERIISKANQFSDHNRTKIELRFEVKLAEAEAILERFYAGSKKEFL